MNINLHIDHLVLDGLPLEEGQGGAIQAAVEAELARLLASGDLASALRMGGARASVAGGDIQLTGNHSPAALGRQIGRAVYGGINP
jgi:hypothetical protein